MGFAAFVHDTSRPSTEAEPRKRSTTCRKTAAVITASSVAAATSDALFDALNYADTAKLMLLAVFTAAVTVAGTRAGMLRRWMRPLTAVLVFALPVGGLAFVVPSAVLTAVLYVSLPVLLIWAGATAWQLGRNAL